MHDLLRSETPSRRAGLRDGVKSCHEIDAAASAVAGTIGPLRISGNEARYWSPYLVRYGSYRIHRSIASYTALSVVYAIGRADGL